MERSMESGLRALAMGSISYRRLINLFVRLFPAWKSCFAREEHCHLGLGGVAGSAFGEEF